MLDFNKQYSIVIGDSFIEGVAVNYENTIVGFLNENLKEEIKSFAIEIDKEMSGNYVENKEDTKIQEEFWKIYFQYINKNEISKTLPRISPSFLRSNLDLLN